MENINIISAHGNTISSQFTMPDNTFLFYISKIKKVTTDEDHVCTIKCFCKAYDRLDKVEEEEKKGYRLILVFLLFNPFRQRLIGFLKRFREKDGHYKIKLKIMKENMETDNINFYLSGRKHNITEELALKIINKEELGLLNFLLFCKSKFRNDKDVNEKYFDICTKNCMKEKNSFLLVKNFWEKFGFNQFISFTNGETNNVICDSEFSFIPNYKKTRNETDSFVSFFYSGIIPFQNIYDKYSVFQEDFDRAGKSIPSIISNFEGAKTSKIIEPNDIFLDEYSNLYKFETGKSFMGNNRKIVRSKLPSILDKAFSLSPKYLEDWKRKKDNCERYLNKMRFQQIVIAKLKDKYFDLKNVTRENYLDMVDNHSQEINLFKDTYPVEYKEILNNYDRFKNFEENFLDKIPSWNNLYNEKLSEILSSNSNSVYFISACRVCSQVVVDQCPGQSSEINLNTIPNTNNPLTNFLKSINVYDRLIDGTLFEFN